MRHLPSISGPECVETLRRMGFRVTNTGGALVSLKRGDRIVVVPQDDPLPDLQLKLVLACAGVSHGDFAWYGEAPSWRHVAMEPAMPESRRPESRRSF